MQQEYTPYGPEWAKEIKKLTKDQIIDNLLRPALMKAKAEPAALPDNKDREILKILVEKTQAVFDIRKDRNEKNKVSNAWNELSFALYDANKILTNKP